MSNTKTCIGFTTQNLSMDLSNYSGASLQLAHIIRFLRQSGNTVTVLSVELMRQIRCETAEDKYHWADTGFSNSKAFKLFESGVRRLQTLFHLPYLGIFDSYRFYNAALHELKSCDILHERYSLMALGTTWASKKLSIPLVLSLDADETIEMKFMGQPLSALRYALLRLVARYIFNHASAFTCVAQASKENFVTHWKIPEEKIFVIPNTADTNFFQPDLDDKQTRKKYNLGDAPVILFVGGFWPWQDIGVLVKAFQSVVNQVPTAKLLMVGDGLIKADIVEQVKQMNLKQSVVFTGALNYRQLPEIIAAADIATVQSPLNAPNSTLGSPMKLYEYMAAGKAIIASEIGQTTTVIKSGENGLLVQPGNEQQLADAIIQLIKNPQTREKLAANARRQAVESHSWRNYIQKLGNVYEYVLLESTRKPSSTNKI